MPGFKRFIAELQRRHVIRAAVAHVIVFWLLIQVADVVLPYVGIVDEPVRWALVAGIALLPVTLIVAWFFEHPWREFTRGRIAIDVIVIVIIAVTAGSWVLRNLPQVVHTRTSIVILPFEHSGDPLEQSLSRALAYEVNSLLMKSKSIDVIGFQSANSLVLSGLGTMGVAERLNVQNILTGEVSVTGNAMRVALNLTDSLGEELWSSVIENSLDNLFDVQENIAVAIEARLGAGDDTVSVESVAALRCWMPTDPEALEHYYTARYYVELRNDTDVAVARLREAVAIYRDLIEQYPQFAEAHSGLAWAIAYQYTYDPEFADPEWQTNIQPIAREALRHCATLGEAMHLIPNEFDHDNEWIGQHRQLTAFIESEPHKTEYYQHLARHYREAGLNDRAVEVAERNYELNPLSVRAIKELAFAYMQVDRMGEASDLFELQIELGSTSPNYAATFSDECSDTLECVIEQFPMFQPFADQMREMSAVPATDEDRDRSVSIAMALLAEEPDLWINLVNASACTFDHLTPVFFMSWDYIQDKDAYWYWPNAWNADCGNVWSAQEFPAFVAEVGLVEYWREVGWPAMCQPDGDSVVCGEPTQTMRK